ncbi:MAG: PD-(D/E)XK nuclease family protein, partial [Candidatus Kapaibacterium sp.]
MSLLLYNNALPSRSPLDLDSYILNVAEEGKLEEYAFVLPTGRKVRELERRLTDKHYEQTGKPLTHLPLFTMSSFTEALYDQLAPGRREASMEIQIALIERAMKSVDLNYFARPGRDPSLGVVEQVTRVISGVRADGILPTQFEMDIQAAQENPELMVGYDTVKLRDLYNIYSEYLRILGDTWIDYPGRILRVNTELFNNPDKLFRASFPQVHTLLIHDHTEFTWPEIDLVTRLGVVKNLNALLVFDYEEGNGPLYGNFEEVIEKLKAGGYGTERLDPIDLDVPEEQRRPFTHHMRRNLFRTDERIANPAFDERIGIYSFHTREEEVRGIAGLVKSLVFDEGIPPERICITTLNMENYTELLREYLPSYGIPANITARYPLEQNGLITALFSALNILAAGYDRRDVLRAVTSPYLSFGENVDPAALTDAGTKLRITRGYQAWRRRIGRRIEFLLTRLKSGLDLDERRGLEIELETLRRAERSIELVHDTLGEFSTHLSPTEFRAAFLRLIAKLKGTENILHIRRNLEAQPRTPADWQRIHDEMERDTRALARFLGLLDELTELFELDAEEERKKAEKESVESPELESEESESVDVVAASLQPAPGMVEAVELKSEESEIRESKKIGLHRLGYYLDHLRTAAARSFYTIREKHDYGLLVTHLDQVQGETFDVVIMCGLVDGEFPSTYIPANFLGKPLETTEERQLRRERIAFYTGLTSFSERIYLTYPRTQGDRELVRSSFLDALIRITTVEESGRVIPYKELRIEREERRGGKELVPDRDFPAMVATLDVLSEEAGAVLWKGGTLPRVEEGKDILDHLKHTVAVEVGRARAEEDATVAAEYRGILTDALTEEEQALLAERRDKEYSASQLETYAKCPFKYFTRRLLNVDAPARFDVTLTPL